MRPLIRSTIYLRAAAVAAGLWLGAGGAAWAGDGADLGSLQALLNDPTAGLCKLFGIAPCPVPPTITQAVLEVAALGNNLPEMVRAQNNIGLGGAVSAGNPAIATTPPDLSKLTPLAFISQSSGTAAATQLYDRNADGFLYAVAVSSIGFVGGTGLPSPDIALFVYDDLFRNNVNFATGTTIAKFSFPLTVLNSNGSERAVSTTLNFVANNFGDCSTSTVKGSFSDQISGTQTLPASQIGISCGVSFGPSPASPQKHVIFQVTVPLLVTGANPPPNTDPAHFYSDLHPGQANPVNAGVYTAFAFNDQPANSGNLGTGISIGLAPSAGPLAQPTAASASFALCASLPVNNDSKLRPAVGAYYAVATSGEMLLSAPLGGGTETGAGVPSVCPPL